MKAILWFKLSDPEDLLAFKQAYNAESMALALWDLDQELRRLIKYENMDELQYARDLLHETLGEHGINLEEITQ